jgi:hypothetical protein
MEVVYTWPDGREEVRYRRPTGSAKAIELESQVQHLRKIHGPGCPYSCRYPAKPVDRRTRRAHASATRGPGLQGEDGALMNESELRAVRLPPRSPYRFCLYRVFDDVGRLIYVGISNSVLSRLETHAGSSVFFDRARVIHIQRFESRGDARHHERRAILREKPLLNIQDRKGPMPRGSRGQNMDMDRGEAFGQACRLINAHFDQVDLSTAGQFELGSKVKPVR